MASDDDRIRDHYESLDDSQLAEAFAHGPEGYASSHTWAVIAAEFARRGLDQIHPADSTNQGPAYSGPEVDKGHDPSLIASFEKQDVILSLVVATFLAVIAAVNEDVPKPSSIAGFAGSLVGLMMVSVVVVYIGRRIVRALRGSHPS